MSTNTCKILFKFNYIKTEYVYKVYQYLYRHGSRYFNLYLYFTAMTAVYRILISTFANLYAIYLSISFSALLHLFILLIPPRSSSLPSCSWLPFPHFLVQAFLAHTFRVPYHDYLFSISFQLKY